MNIFEGISCEKFPQYHTDNPHIYEMFKKFTFEMIRAGHRNFGSKSIVERMRWESMISANTGQFKISNQYTPLYSRMFANEFPEYKDVFRYRKSKYDDILDVNVNFDTQIYA